MEEENKKIAETVPIFFFIYNLKKKDIDFISPQFYEVVGGIESEEENPLRKSIHPDYLKEFEKFFEDLTEKNHYEGSVELKASDHIKGIEWLELNTFPVKERDMSEVTQVVGHIVNITKKKEVYDTLRNEKEHISNMMNMMAHDLRAPFHRIQMIADLLESSMGEEEYDKYKTYVEMLRRQGQESMGLIERLLRLATLKGQAHALDLKIHDLRRLVEEAVDSQKPRMEEKKLELSCEFPDESVKARLDAILFHQVMENLLSNAIKYTPQGGKILCSLRYEGAHIKLSVADTGIGIPAKPQKGLFNNFFGYRRSGLEGEKSIGLGLFICKEIVKMHQGEIDVESKEGEGSTFTVTLPFPESSAAYY
jgi:two-component system sensor histidine kinase VicK